MEKKKIEVKDKDNVNAEVEVENLKRVIQKAISFIVLTQHRKL